MQLTMMSSGWLDDIMHAWAAMQHPAASPCELNQQSVNTASSIGRAQPVPSVTHASRTRLPASPSRKALARPNYSDIILACAIARTLQELEEYQQLESFLFVLL